MFVFCTKVLFTKSFIKKINNFYWDPDIPQVKNADPHMYIDIA